MITDSCPLMDMYLNQKKKKILVNFIKIYGLVPTLIELFLFILFFFLTLIWRERFLMNTQKKKNMYMFLEGIYTRHKGGPGIVCL